MALVFAATIANRWFVARRGLVMGILTAAGATGQLIFLPILARLTEQISWRAASLMIALAALAVVPFVLLVLRDYPADRGVRAYGAPLDVDDSPRPDPAGAARRAVGALRAAARTTTFWALAGGFAICGATTNGLIGRTSFRRLMIMAWRCPPPQGCWRWSASSTSREPSSPARSPTRSTRGCCWWVTTSSVGSACWSCPGCCRIGCASAC